MTPCAVPPLNTKRTKNNCKKILIPSPHGRNSRPWASIHINATRWVPPERNLQNVSTAKYLCVNIQDNLNWGLHIDTTTNKANKTLCFLRRNLKIGNKKSKETAYKAFVHPILEYSATVWDPHSANNIKTIEKVQRRAARWVRNRHHQTACVNSIIDSLAWPTLQQRRKKLDLKCFTNFTTTLSPLILNTYHSKQKPDQATERTTYTATTSPTAGHSTDRCHSSPGPSPNGTACPRK